MTGCSEPGSFPSGCGKVDGEAVQLSKVAVGNSSLREFSIDTGRRGTFHRLSIAPWRSHSSRRRIRQNGEFSTGALTSTDS